MLFGLYRKGHGVAFPTQTHDHVFSLPDRSLLAQPVSQGTETELWCQSGFSCAALRGRDPHSQMEPALHSHRDINHLMCNFMKHTEIVHLFLICQPNIALCAASANSLSPCLLSDVRAQRRGRLTPWIHLWTQPGITFDTQTLITQTGITASP